MSRRDELQRAMMTATSDVERDAIMAELVEIARSDRRGPAALKQWRKEVADGKRTATAPLDDLWRDACHGAADEEFERTVAAPQRAAVAAIRSRHG